jgi:hypothetical protein
MIDSARPANLNKPIIYEQTCTLVDIVVFPQYTINDPNIMQLGILNLAYDIK